jgi:hypothetical protein
MMTEREYRMGLTVREYRANTSRLDAMPHAQLLALIDAVPTVVWDRSVPLDEVHLVCDTDTGQTATLVYKLAILERWRG